MNNYQLSVPVFIHYLNQLNQLIEKIEPLLTSYQLTERQLLDLQLKEKMLPFGQQINVAVSFAVRCCYPLAGKSIPELYYDVSTLADIKANLTKELSVLKTLKEADFTQANIQSMTIQPGESSQPQTLNAIEFIQLYNLPNFFFHFSMVYALLRQQGFEIGKGDFDGFTQFPSGFSYV